MHCVQPPLAAKPAKGYGWSCAPCAKRHEDHVDRQGARSESPPRTSKTRQKAKIAATVGQSSTSAVDVDKEEIKHFKMWPFRYFGCVRLYNPMTVLIELCRMYTDAYDTLGASIWYSANLSVLIRNLSRSRRSHLPSPSYARWAKIPGGLPAVQSRGRTSGYNQ